MAVNKTLYVRDEDARVWEKARELAGERLSSFLTNYLKEFVASKEASSAGFERILLKFREHGKLPRVVAFNGRWLISPEESWDPPGVDFPDPEHYAIAVTAKGRVVVFRFERTEDGTITSGHYWIFESFEEAAEHTKGTVIATAMERMGIEVQELDI